MHKFIGLTLQIINRPVHISVDEIQHVLRSRDDSCIFITGSNDSVVVTESVGVIYALLNMASPGRFISINTLSGLEIIPTDNIISVATQDVHVPDGKEYSPGSTIRHRCGILYLSMNCPVSVDAIMSKIANANSCMEKYKEK